MILLDILTAVFTAYSFTWRTPQFVIPKAASLDFFATDIAIDARIFKFNLTRRLFTSFSSTPCTQDVMELSWCWFSPRSPLSSTLADDLLSLSLELEGDTRPELKFTPVCSEGPVETACCEENQTSPRPTLLHQEADHYYHPPPPTSQSAPWLSPSTLPSLSVD